MKSIKLFLIITLLYTFDANAQSVSAKTWSGETYLSISAFRLGSYQKERPTIFLEQNLNYRIIERFSVGVGTGISVYPALLGFPVKVDGRYHFLIKSTSASIVQSYGRNIKLSDVFFSSNRYVGEMRVHLPVGKMTLLPRVGYNLLWDKYDGRSLSFLVGIGIEY